MSFSINQLDNIDTCNDDTDKEFNTYLDFLLEQFHNAPECEEHRQTNGDIGFWSGEFVYFGFIYIGVTLPCMDVTNVKEIVTDLFPQKVMIDSPAHANKAIPELLAFWHFLKREYELKNADSIIKYLSKIRTEFKDIMSDSSKFGMSKSFMTAGKDAGFDMTKEGDMSKFTALYNASISSPQSQNKFPANLDLPARQKTEKDDNKKKLRKMASLSRKKNRKRK